MRKIIKSRTGTIESLDSYFEVDILCDYTSNLVA